MATIFKIPVSLLIVTCGLAAACSGTPPAASPADSVVVSSSDGSATLVIPSGALPNGVAASSVTIGLRPVSDLQAGAGMLAGYDLSPDGLAFSQPAILTLGTPWTEFLPHVLLLSDDKADLLEPTYTLDPEANVLSVAVEVNHFSTAVLEKGNIKATISNAGDHTVGAPFDVQVSITRVTESRGILDESTGGAADQLLSKALNLMINVETFGPLTVKGNGFFEARSPIDPTNVRAPGSDLVADEETLTFSQRFQCNFSGSGLTATYTGYLDQAAKATTILFISHTRTGYITVKVTTRRFNCLSPEPTVTASPSPTPSPTPSPAATLSNVVDQMEGTYSITRIFDANTCGYETYYGTADMSTGVDNVANNFYIQMVTDSPLLSHMDYRGKVLADGNFTGTEVDPEFYDAIINAVYINGEITFNERITMFRDDSPCKGQTFTTHGTAVQE